MNLNSATILLALATVSPGATILTSGFDGNTGATDLAGNTDNTSGSATVGITDWTTDPVVSSISGLTAISTTSGGFAQLQGGSATYANGDVIYISRNHNQDGFAGQRGFSLEFTTTSTIDLSTLTVLSGHTTNTGIQDQAFSSDLVYSLSGGTLGSALSAADLQVDYNIAPDYRTRSFDLSGNTIVPGTYTLSIYQENLTGGGAYATFNGLTLEGLIVPEASTAALVAGFLGFGFLSRRR